MVLSGRIEIAQVESPALRESLFGDPVVRDAPVYLPPSYDSDRQRRFPVVYCLHGFTGTGRGWLNGGPLQRTLPERIDRLITERRCDEVILVMPDGWSYFGGGQYVNSVANGRHEDYICEDVVGAIDRTYRTVADAAGRGIAGKSSGGFGALTLAMHRPDRFSAVACHSGDMYFELCYKPDFPKFLKAVERAGGLDAFVHAYPESAWQGASPGDVLSILGMAAAYSPNPERPPYFCDLPLDLFTGELDQEVWGRWLTFDPVHTVSEFAQALRALKLLYFDAGTRDEFHLQFGARILNHRLKALGIPFQHEEFDGGHLNIDYRYEISIPRIVIALNAD